MDSQDNDSALVRRVQQGDRQAFNLLVHKYQYRVRHLVARFVQDAGEQEDVVQESFIKAWRAMARFRGDSSFYTWLYRIAVNTAKNHLVAAGRRPPGQDVEADESVHVRGGALVDDNSPDRIAQNDELVALIQNTLRTMPRDLREAIELREFDGLSYEDIAAAMDCPVGTVRSRIFRARETIERAIAAQADGGAHPPGSRK